MKLVAGELAAISPCSSPLATFCEEERLRLNDRNSILMSDISQCLHIKNLVQSFGPKVKFVQFYISPGRFGKVLCSSANEFQQNSNSIYSTNIDCFVIDSSCLHLTCLSFVTNSWNHLKYNYSIAQSALMTRQILHYHYGIFCRWVTEVSPCEMSPSGDEQGEMCVFTG